MRPKNVEYKFFIMFSTIVCVLSACSPSIVQVNTNTQITQIPLASQSDCISPIYPSFAYPSGTSDKKEPIPGRDLIVLPPYPWQAETTLPPIKGVGYGDEYYSQQATISILQVRSMKDYFEIWVSIPLLGSNLNNLAVYRTDTKTWKIIPERITSLIVDKNGSLWGTQSTYTYADAIDTRLLSTFNDTKNIFVARDELKNIPSGTVDSGIYYYSKVLLDKNDIFWILVPNDAIYSYDLITGQTMRRIDLPFIVDSAQLALDGSIYILPLPSWDEPFGQSKSIYQFFPQDNKMEAFRVNLEPYPFVHNILVDHLGRLWLDNSGYRDKNGFWYQLQRSPIFYSSWTEGGNDFAYKSAKILLESSDRRLWFLHRNNGMVSLDPEKGEWCWFTTYQSNIVEDTQHNLWMIADGKLYKYPLNP